MKSRTGKVNHADGNQISSLGGNKGGKTEKTQKGTLLSDGNIIYLDGMVVTQVCTFVNCHPKGIVICEFYFLCKLYCKKKKVVKKKRLWLYIILQIFYSHMNFIFSASFSRMVTSPQGSQK